ncbi:MAG: haloacid dehalogenase-like hydrolase [Erysipelotrichaceae bacterium]|nr:haloacid dehalogenase-like hydrolase [Erysipelotrichaceae bacterium]
MNRILDCSSSDLRKMGKSELLQAIAGSEGRVMMCETVGTVQPMLGNISNAEFVASMGAEMINLNVFDLDNPVINGLPASQDNIIDQLRKLTGCLIGINLEPVASSYEFKSDTNIWALTKGRAGTLENARKAYELGVNFITLTGNPGVGVDNKSIAAALKTISGVYDRQLILIAGKMHASGVLAEAGEKIITLADIKLFIDSGADIILLPAPGTVPGITMEYIRELIAYVHQRQKLALTAIGTSQEGADTDTIKQIALMCKMAGADIHHIGDAGYLGMALPENIFAYSVAIRGIRHTYRRMAMSINR